MCVAIRTGVVGVKWRQKAAVRYHVQKGPASTQCDGIHSHRSSTGFDFSQRTTRAVKGLYRATLIQPWWSGSTDSKLHICELSAVTFSVALLDQIPTWKQHRVRRSKLIAVNETSSAK